MLQTTCRFGSYKVVQTITEILGSHFKGCWITFPKVPKDVVARMYDVFRVIYQLLICIYFQFIIYIFNFSFLQTRWSWDPSDEQLTFEGFINVLKECYRDIMGRMREKAAYTAMEAGHFIDNKDPKRYTIIREYPPHKIPRNIWREMYKIWGSEKWQKKSIAGKRNRASADRSGKRSRHTGGSVGFDEHRIRLKTKLGWEPSFGEVFLETHLTKESKVKLWAGELQINNMEGMNFCTARARKAYEAYLIEMKTLYGPSFTKDDPAVWARVNAGGRWNHVYGIGSTDINHLMTGNLSTSYVPELYQDKIRALETQIQESEARLESERKAMDEALQAQREVDRKSREEDLQSKLEDFIRNGCSKD